MATRRKAEKPERPAVNSAVDGHIIRECRLEFFDYLAETDRSGNVEISLLAFKVYDKKNNVLGVIRLIGGGLFNASDFRWQAVDDGFNWKRKGG